MYYSQAGQDKWVHEIIGDKGFFVDVGAYDGIQTSNTYALELAGWQGICVEGNREIFKTLVSNRNCRMINSVVTDYKGICGFGIDKIEKQNENNPEFCDTLDNILIFGQCPQDIDYLSLDIEGNEFKVLNAFDFDYYKVRCITVEHNLYCDGPANKDAIYDLLTKNGFARVKDNVLCPDPNYLNQPFEDWYAKIEG